MIFETAFNFLILLVLAAFSWIPITFACGLLSVPLSSVVKLFSEKSAEKIQQNVTNVGSVICSILAAWMILEFFYNIYAYGLFGANALFEQAINFSFSSPDSGP